MSKSPLKTGGNPGEMVVEVSLPGGERAVLRPLEFGDVESLTDFLKDLSPKTREFYVLDDYDKDTAAEMCDAIGKYDKVRFVLTSRAGNEIIGLFEYALDILDKEMKRFKRYGIRLSSETDCRFGLCLADKYQSGGVGSMLFPYLVDIAKRLGCGRMILWGGVFADNERAIRFYLKNGFVRLEEFDSDEGERCVDMILEL